MTVIESDGATASSPASAVRATLSGSFRRDLEALAQHHASLEAAGCIVVSPRDTHFVAEVDGFVLASHELMEKPDQIEALHLDAIVSSDFVWLHAPEGYVGPSASLEIGFAHAIGIPVFTDERPSDGVIAGFVHVVDTPARAVTLAAQRDVAEPGRGIGALQRYYQRVAESRGYEHETARDAFLLFVEEVGELATTLRKRLGLIRKGTYTDVEVGEELADLQLYLVHLANILQIDLAEAVTQKERLNTQRYEQAATTRSER